MARFLLQNETVLTCRYVWEALVPRMDTASSGHAEHEEIRRYCLQGQGFQECNRLLLQGTHSHLSFFLFFLQCSSQSGPVIVQLVSMMPAPSGTVFVRRGLSYLMIGQAELALRDAMQAQVCLPEWPMAFYMQALALSKLGMETDAQDMLHDGASFEAKKQNSWRN